MDFVMSPEITAGAAQLLIYSATILAAVMSLMLTVRA